MDTKETRCKTMKKKDEKGDKESGCKKMDERGDERKGNKIPSRLVQKKSERLNTRWSYYALGNVIKEEVCIKSMNQSCAQEKTGCSKLHATVPWHWQIKNTDGSWYNILIIQSKELERAYQDVTIDKIKVSPMERKHTTTYGCAILKMLGKGWCEADFTSMTMKRSDGSQIFKLRRLSTPSAAVSDSEYATTYDWFFQERKKWIAMENSLQVEEHYMKKLESNGSVILQHNKYEYELNFVSMTRKNLTTDKEAAIRRRPKKRPDLQPKEKKMRQRALWTAKLPSTWAAMDSTESQVLCPLDPNSEEFLEVEKRMSAFIKKAKNVKIFRVQSSVLYLPLKNKITEITRRKKSKPLVLRLFHWPLPDHVDNICKNNFSPQWQHPGITHDYGRGVYFFKSVSSFSGQPKEGVVFLADVLIGTYVHGDTSMVGPPKMPGSRNVYDTTVDHQPQPTIYVKYFKRDFCPRYMVEFSA